ASLNMYRALTEAGARADLHLYSGQPHGWVRWPEWVTPTIDEAGLFLDRYLVNPQKWSQPPQA
ncbi:MAG: hypothetical protein KDI19_09255, partial [Pseudomonadales bacterium]|nr:hypothetical protein [Pseudomonadales bacterium]